MKARMCKNFISDTCKILMLIIFIFSTTCLNGQQSKIDSLKYTISSAKDDTVKIILLEQLGQAYRDEKKIDSSILSYKQALVINEKHNYSLQKQCDDISTIDYLLHVTGNYTESLKYAIRHLVLSENLKDTFQMGFSHAVFGHNYKALGEYRLSLNHYFKARQIFNLYFQVRNIAESDPYIIQCIGDVYLKMNQLDSALIFTQLSLVEAETKDGDPGNKLYSTRVLGDIYLAKGEDERALNYYREYIPGFIKYNIPGLTKYKQKSRDLGFVFNSMAKVFQKRGQTDSAVFYAKIALSNAREYHDEQNIYDAATALYNFYDDKIDHKKILDTQDRITVNNKVAIVKIDSLKKELALSKTDSAKVEVLIQLGNQYRNASKPDSFIVCFQQALELIQKNKFSLEKELEILGGLDFLTNATGNYSMSMQYSNKALELSEQIKSNPAMAAALSSIATNYSGMGDFRKALDYFFKAKKAYETFESGHWAIQNIAETYFKMHKLDSALYYNKIAYHIADTGHNQQYMIDFAIRVFAAIYEEKGEDQLALKNYRQFIADFYKYNLSNREVDRAYLGIAKIYLKKNEIDSSIFYAKKALTAAQIYNDQEHILNASDLLYNLHDSLKDESQAFTYFKIAEAAKDSMASIEKIRQIQMLTFNEQTREKELAEADAKEAARTKLIIIIASVMGLIISFLAWNRIRQLRLKHKMILDQKEAEKLRAIDRMKEKFFTNITHELRTPLSLIMSPAEFYLQHPEELDDTPKFLESIYKNSGYLLNLINQLLDISKLDAGKMNISLSKGDFGNYISDILKTFEEDAAKKQIGLSFESDLHGDYLFDPEQWKKITSNLLSNALKFTPPGGSVFVTLKKITDSAESATIQLSVKDNGIGIQKDQLPFITDRFYQADHHLTRKYEGTGIGLSLVNELVKLMNGTLEIKSEEGKGSVFAVSTTLLSAQGKEDFPALPSLATSIRFSGNGTSPKNILRNTEKNVPLILVAEDNPELNDFIKNSLDNLYNVFSVSNGLEGFEIAASRLPDIIISDVMMPVMDGFEFCDKIKTNPTTSHIPFIILSARTTYESRMTGLQKGADDYLTKPFSVDELLSKIKNILKRQERLKTTYENKLIELEAKALRAQMNPHFIFNCLNSIKALMQEEETEKGVKYLTTFSKLIRTLFNNADKKEISLYDEIETCKFYLQLEAMRFDSAFSYAIDMDPEIDLKSVCIPALIIQPFIENAIWHGIVPAARAGKIWLNVTRSNGYVNIIVEDDGIGREVSQKNKAATKLTHDSKGVNLTQSRLELDNLLRQRHAKMEIIDKRDAMGNSSGTKVIIKIEEETE